MFNSFPTDLTEKQHINREAKEARGTKMANTCRDSFKSDEDKRENLGNGKKETQEELQAQSPPPQM